MDYSLYESVESTPGWLYKVTALRTIDILDWQVSNGISGNLLEIGVYCGKYFTLLVDSAIKGHGHAYGIDTFQFSSPDQVATFLHIGHKGKEDNKHTLWTDQSTRVPATRIASEAGPLRFISIDGAHDYENVYRDLVLCDQIVSVDGLIAADDFLNPVAIGVNQAVNKFLSEPRAVVPVAYTANKLFLAHRSRQDDYRKAFEAMFMAGEDSECDNFRTQIAHGRHHVEQDFYGHKILIL